MTEKKIKKEIKLLCPRPFFSYFLNLGHVERLAGAPFQRDRADARHFAPTQVVREKDRDRIHGSEFRDFESLRRSVCNRVGAQLELGRGGVGLRLGEADRGPVDEDADAPRGLVGFGGPDGDGGELDSWRESFFPLGG